MQSNGTTLTAPERSKLRQCEKEIRKGRDAVDRNFVIIQEQRLYREKFATFEEYCKEVWGFKRSWVYERISAEKTRQKLVAANVDETAIPQSTKARVALSKAPDEKLTEIIEQVEERAAIEDRKPTANDYEQVVKMSAIADKIEDDDESKMSAIVDKINPKTAKNNGKTKDSVETMVHVAKTQYVSPLVKLVEKIAKANGGKGSVYESADKHLDGILDKLDEMEAGNQ